MNYMLSVSKSLMVPASGPKNHCCADPLRVNENAWQRMGYAYDWICMYKQKISKGSQSELWNKSIRGSQKRGSSGHASTFNENGELLTFDGIELSALWFSTLLSFCWSSRICSACLVTCSWGATHQSSAPHCLGGDW